MKIVVIGGTGLIGSKTVAILRQGGHEVIAASPNTGVNSITGEGLKEAMAGTQVVVDLANSPSFEDTGVLEFFETSGRNLLAAEAVAGVRHHVALSIVGTDRTPDNGYFRAKLAQEKLIEASGIPYTIIRSTTGNRANDSLQKIAQLFDRNHSSVERILAETGGICPAQRCRSRLSLTLAEREEISRAIAAGQSIRSVAAALKRAPSTVSREIKRNGGIQAYRANLADQRAWDRARRPKPCKLVMNRKLADASTVVAGKDRIDSIDCARRTCN